MPIKKQLKLLLFVSKCDQACRKAVRTVKRLPLEQTSLLVLDVGKFPRVASRYGVARVPSLVKKSPGPEALITGDFQLAHRVMAALSLCVHDSQKRLIKLRSLQRAIPVFTRILD